MATSDQGPCYSIEVALMMMSVWTRAVETEADVQTTGFVDDSAVRSKRGKTRGKHGKSQRNLVQKLGRSATEKR